MFGARGGDDAVLTPGFRGIQGNVGRLDLRSWLGPVDLGEPDAQAERHEAAAMHEPSGLDSRPKPIAHSKASLNARLWQDHREFVAAQTGREGRPGAIDREELGMLA